MATYIISLENIGYSLLNEVRIFNKKVKQDHIKDIDYSIFRELVSQIIAAYTLRMNPETFAMSLASLPEWRTILYVENEDHLFDLKRDFSAIVIYYATAIYTLLSMHTSPPAGARVTYLMENVTAANLIVNEYIEPN